MISTRNYRILLALLSSSLTLSACIDRNIKDPDSYFYSVPVGSTLRLNQAITIPPNLARRFFQNGQPTLEKNLNIYYPYCSILMNTLVDYERTIKPTTFKIYQVQDDEELAQRFIYYASNVLTTPEGPTIIGYATYYFLRSTDEPDVRSLECLQWDDPYNVRYLSINQVRSALGDYFTLELAE